MTACRSLCFHEIFLRLVRWSSRRRATRLLSRFRSE